MNTDIYRFLRYKKNRIMISKTILKLIKKEIPKDLYYVFNVRIDEREDVYFIVEEAFYITEFLKKTKDVFSNDIFSIDIKGNIHFFSTVYSDVDILSLFETIIRKDKIKKILNV